MRKQVGQAEIGLVIGAIGGVLGLVAGFAELTIGPEIRGWVGDKRDTTGLGLVTMALSLLALAGVWSAMRTNEIRPIHRAAVLLALFVPALICFTTVGALWYVPGPILILAATLTARGLGHRDERLTGPEDRTPRLLK